MSKPDGLLTARIVIEKYITAADEPISIIATDADGNGIRLVESLGMLELGKDSLIREAMGEVD